MTSITDSKAATTLFGFDYQRDSMGLVTSTVATNLPQNETYHYSPLNQVDKLNSASYSYDGADNLTGLPNGSTMGYDAADQLTSRSDPPGISTTYLFDDNGNRTGEVSLGLPRNYNFDRANRMYSTSKGVGNDYSYTYDGDGLRTVKAKSSGLVTRTFFTYDLSGSIPLLIAEGNDAAVTTSYIYGPSGQVLEQATAGARTYMHHDQLGSIRALTDQSGAIVGTATYDPYGNKTASSGATTTPFGFAGEYTDAETGLVYLRARYYDPVTGQFLNRDPLEAITGSPYGYVNSNPVNAIDPLGLESLGDIWHELWRHPLDSIHVGWSSMTTQERIADASLPVILPLLVLGCYKGWETLSEALGGVESTTATTAHGAERLAQGGFTDEMVALTKSGQVFQQADGATVYLRQISDGRFDFIVEGENGIITAHTNWPENAVLGIAERYGWNWP